MPDTADRAATERPARTAEPAGRPQWQDLFQEPDLPPWDEGDDDV